MFDHASHHASTDTQNQVKPVDTLGVEAFSHLLSRAVKDHRDDLSTFLGHILSKEEANVTPLLKALLTKLQVPYILPIIDYPY